MRCALALAALVVAPALVLAQVSTKDFARGAEIRTDGGGSLYRIELPDEAYDTSTRPDLADMRVLNATGETVPHTLREVPRTASPDSVWRLVPSFPMTEAESGAAARTHVKVGADGAVLEVTNDRKAGRSTTAYLVDATGLTEPISRMSLTWDAAPGATFLVPVSVSASDDLNSWRTIVPSAAIAQLRRDTFMLTQNEIELAGAKRAKYFRISWPRELADVTVKSVRLRPRTNAAQPEIHWRTVSAERVEPVGTAQYDTHAFLPIEYLDLEFADPTDTDLITIRSRPASSSPWELSHSGLFYVLQGPDGPIRSPYAHIGRTTERYWTVETMREGGWKQNRAPRLKVGWHPHELVFVARGAAPYTLAYGSGRVGPADAPVGELLASLNQAGGGAQVRVATLSQPHNLGGADALEPPPTPLPWKRIVLWAVLIVAVGGLAVVAARLLRETKNAA